jgi:hypothetical protein
VTGYPYRVQQKRSISVSVDEQSAAPVAHGAAIDRPEFGDPHVGRKSEQ